MTETVALRFEDPATAAWFREKCAEHRRQGYLTDADTFALAALAAEATDGQEGT